MVVTSGNNSSAPASPVRLGRGTPPRFAPAIQAPWFAGVMEDRPMGGRFRAARRLALVLLWTVLSLPVQALILALPLSLAARARVRFARLFWRNVARLLGLRLRVIGVPPAGPGTLFLGNHSSWLDIVVLGGVLEACFVSKAEVARWPVIGTVARLGRTVFVSRERGRTGAEADEMRARLTHDDSLILFPEGTSSDGGRVLPFRSSFLAVAPSAARLQPVSVGYDRLGWLPTGRRDRPVFAWFGDMGIAEHLWALARQPGIQATVLLHPPVAPDAQPNRKLLSAAVERTVSDGAAALRQHREDLLPVPADAAAVDGPRG
ncbi:lysophospholipid acyltransferase family protein [Roseomonas elaeocarpi]|uniref:Lysophospholipid acyltransferase family protein n=1 Tax=Roseomonas elaeocarpi TaxID=907779 RepID=A0ABV6JZM4_9PROT